MPEYRYKKPIKNVTTLRVLANKIERINNDIESAQIQLSYLCDQIKNYWLLNEDLALMVSEDLRKKIINKTLTLGEVSLLVSEIES
jgi:hypothetical protein